MSNFKKLIEQIETQQKKFKEMIDKFNEPMRTMKAQQESFKRSISLKHNDIDRLFQLPESIIEMQEMNSNIIKLLQNSTINQIMKKIPKFPEFSKFQNNTLNSLTVLPPLSNNEDIKIQVDIIKDSDDIDVIVSEKDGKIIIRVKKSEDKDPNEK